MALNKLRRLKRLIKHNKVGDYLKGDKRFNLPLIGVETLFRDCGALTLSLPASQFVTQGRDSMIVPAAEAIALAVACQHARPARVFEIGTYKGTSTLVMAMNTPSDAKILTLDIGLPEYTAGEFFKKTPVESKITQYFGDSRTFDFSQYYGTMDLVFVDANHTYEFVKSDSTHAFKLIKPGGIIFWDDYRWTSEYPECSGVADYLHEQARVHKIYQLQGTRFAVCRD